MGKSFIEVSFFIGVEEDSQASSGSGLSRAFQDATETDC